MSKTCFAVCPSAGTRQSLFEIIIFTFNFFTIQFVPLFHVCITVTIFSLSKWLNNSCLMILCEKNYYFIRFKLKFILYINSVIPLVTLKLSIGSKKLPKFICNNLYCPLATEKNLKSNPNSIVTLTPNLTTYFSTFWFFFANISICKHVSDKIAKPNQNFTTAFMYDIMRYWQIS